MGSKGGSKPPTPAPAGASLVDQYTPWGNQTYKQIGTVHVKNGPDQPRYQATTTLSPGQQKLLWQNQEISGHANQMALDQEGRLRDLLGHPADFSGASGDAVQKALYSKQTSMLDPQFQQESAHVAAQLAAQGVNPGSAAFNEAMDNFSRHKQGAYETARNDSILAGGQEQSRQVQQIIAERQAPLNELNALLGRAGSVQPPQFNSQGQAAVAGAQQANNQNAMLGWQQQQQNQQDLMGSLFGLGGTLGTAGILFSDVRLKEHLKPAGKLGPYKLWSYRFKGETKTRLGVIAQEVQQIAPHLVHEMPNGYLGVNYLGLIDVI